MEFRVVVHGDLQVHPERGLHNAELHFKGCTNCAAAAIAEYMVDSPQIAAMIVKAIAIAGSIMEKRKNDEPNKS